MFPEEARAKGQPLACPRTGTLAVVACPTGTEGLQLQPPEVSGEEQHTPDGDMVARRIHVCEVSNGQISAVTTYCNGGWDDELRARHAAEAPMIRP